MSSAADRARAALKAKRLPEILEGRYLLLHKETLLPVGFAISIETFASQHQAESYCASAGLDDTNYLLVPAEQCDHLVFQKTVNERLICTLADTP